MLTIDGRPTPSEGTVLDACRALGIRLPALCHDERLSAGGHCRTCLVETPAGLVAACTMPAANGMEVQTDTERLRSYRRDLGELLLAECSPLGQAAEAIGAWGADGGRYAPSARPARQDRSHAVMILELGRCILCRLCVRACHEMEGHSLLAVEGRGSGARLAWGGGPFAATGCLGCGACVAVCPTGAITERPRS